MIRGKVSHKLDQWHPVREKLQIMTQMFSTKRTLELPESYDENSISEYRQRIYEYVYVRYKEVSWSDLKMHYFILSTEILIASILTRA